MVKLLLDEGAEPSVKEAPLGASKLMPFGPGAQNNSMIPVFRLIIPRILDEIYCETDEEAFDLLWGLRCTAEEFLWLQREVCPSYFDMSLSTRLTLAISAGRISGPSISTAPLIRTMIGQPLSAALGLKTKEVPHMVRLLHLMAIWIGTSMVPRFWRRRDWTQPRTGRKSLISLAQPQEWESERLRQESLYNSSHELFCHVLGLGIGINYVYSGRTAFTTFLSSYLQDFGQWGRKFLVSTLTTPLRKWLADLQAHGVNLVEWGEKEHKLWGSGRIHREIPLSHATDCMHRAYDFVALVMDRFQATGSCGYLSQRTICSRTFGDLSRLTSR
jgi:hypothetical protein